MNTDKLIKHAATWLLAFSLSLGLLLLVIAPVTVRLLRIDDPAHRSNYRIISNGQAFKVQSRARNWPFWQDHPAIHIQPTLEDAKRAINSLVAHHAQDKRSPWKPVE